VTGAIGEKRKSYSPRRRTCGPGGEKEPTEKALQGYWKWGEVENVNRGRSKRSPLFDHHNRRGGPRKSKEEGIPGI